MGGLLKRPINFSINFSKTPLIFIVLNLKRTCLVSSPSVTLIQSPDTRLVICLIKQGN